MKIEAPRSKVDEKLVEERVVYEMLLSLTAEERPFM